MKGLSVSHDMYCRHVVLKVDAEGGEEEIAAYLDGGKMSPTGGTLSVGKDVLRIQC